MKRNELRQQLLSSHLLQSGPFKDHSRFQDVDLNRLYRKFNQTLPELQSNLKEKPKGPLLCPFLFTPQSKFIIGWQIINIILIYLYFMQIPIILAFENHRSLNTNEYFFQLINIPTIVIFTCGIFINLNTSFYKDGMMKSDPSQIKKHYCKKTLAFDVISILAIAIYEILEITKQFQDQALKLFVVLFFLKVFELHNIESTINRSFDLNRRTKATFKLLLLLMKILLICNVVACSAFSISYKLATDQKIINPDGSQCTSQCFWVMNVHYAGKSLYEYDDQFSIQYAYSLYWASTTMISIGYGDITPKNPSQVGFTICIQFLSCLLYGYAINQIWSIIQQLNMKKMKIHSRLNLINVYMRDKSINPELTSKVNAYLNNYYYAKNLRERDAEAEIIGELTPALKKELFYQSYQAIFGHKYFRHTNINLKEIICCVIKQVGYYEDQLIFMEINKQPCLYYIKRGELQCQSGGKSRTFIKNIQKTDLFGVYEFFTQVSFKSELKAIEYSLLFCLKVSDWRRVLKNYKQDFQRYYQTKEQLLLYRNGGVIAYKCQFCSSRAHRTEDCFDDQLRIYIMETVHLTKSGENVRRYYPRREFKFHLHERHDRSKRRPALRTSDYHPRLQSSLNLSVYHQGHHKNHEEMPRRKLSLQQHMDSKRGKIVIRNNRNRQQNMKALEKIRRFHHPNDDQNESNGSESFYEMKYEEFNIDSIAEYQEYYPSFNIKEFTVRDIGRKRMTRLMIR